jgi:prefoldin subunit 5
VDELRARLAAYDALLAERDDLRQIMGETTYLTDALAALRTTSDQLVAAEAERDRLQAIVDEALPLAERLVPAVADLEARLAAAEGRNG